MSLDITIKLQKEHRCPDCGKLVFLETVHEVESAGKEWYNFLIDVGYYIPHNTNYGNTDWYGQDMVLSELSVKSLFAFVHDVQPYHYDLIFGLINEAKTHGLRVTINADW